LERQRAEHLILSGREEPLRDYVAIGHVSELFYVDADLGLQRERVESDSSRVGHVEANSAPVQWRCQCGLAVMPIPESNGSGAAA
jgi:hypothetical protein